MKERCKTPGCKGRVRAAGLCCRCYHREWMGVQRRRERKRQINDDYWRRQLRLVKTAYDHATNLEARLRMKRELETLRRAAN